MNAPWTDRHDHLLRTSAPEADPAAEAEVARTWRAITADTAVRRPRRRWGRIVAAACVAVLAVGSTGIATADRFTARTGQGPVDEEDLRLGGAGERLDGAAPDYGDVIAEETSDIPFPSTYARQMAIAEQLHDARFEIPGMGSVSVGAIRSWVADAAICSWANAWAAATRDGDAAARSEAIAAIRQAPGWAAVMETDPTPMVTSEWSESLDEETGKRETSRYVEESTFFYLARLGKAIGGTDPAPVAAILADQNGYCRPSLVPDIPQADGLYGTR